MFGISGIWYRFECCQIRAKNALYVARLLITWAVVVGRINSPHRMLRANEHQLNIWECTQADANGTLDE
jgi:hypothetical protein